MITLNNKINKKKAMKYPKLISQIAMARDIYKNQNLLESIQYEITINKQPKQRDYLLKVLRVGHNGFYKEFIQ